MRRAKFLLSLCLSLTVLLSIFAPHANAANNAWSSGGPEGGLTRVIVVSPDIANDRTVFAAAQRRGVFKSVDRGSTWQLSINGMGMSEDVRGLVISPAYASDHTLFAGALGGGMYRSRDGAQSWAAINNGLTSSNIWDLALSPRFPSDQIIFAASDDAGVFRSSNGGDTWIQANTGLTLTSILAIAVSPDFANDHVVFAGAQGGLFKSSDGGQTWTWANNGIAAPDIRHVVFSPSYASDGVVFVATESGGLYKSTNRGQSFFDPAGGRGPNPISDITISPTFAQDQTIYTSDGTFGYCKSTDGGATWVIRAPFMRWNPFTTNPDGLSIAISPNYASDGSLWAGTIGTGIFRTQDFAQTWQLVRTGYIAPWTTRVLTSPAYASDHKVFAIALGGGLYGTEDSGQTWRTLNGVWEQHLDFGLSQTLAASPNYASDQTMMVAYVKPYAMVRTRNGGAWWERADTGLTVSDIYGLAYSPDYAADNTVFATSASAGVFRSTDQGDNWAPANTGLSTRRMANIAPSPAYVSDHTLFVGTSDAGVFKSPDGGNTWQQVSTGLSNLNARFVAVSPNYTADQTIFAATPAGIFRSSNAGALWTMVKSGWWFVNLAVSPRFAQDRTVYAGGSQGVMRSTDGGVTWTDMTAGMNQKAVVYLATGLESSGHTLFAATTGGGVLQYTSGNGVPPATTTPTQTSVPGPATATATRTPTPAGPTATRTATRTATAVLSATPTSTALPPGGPYRINAGGPAYVDVSGRVWQADRAYTAGGYGYSGGYSYSVTTPIAATDDDALYQTERYAMSAYTFDLPNATYRVELHFAELYYDAPGKRVFDVKIQGATVLSSFSPFTAAGGKNAAVRYQYLATVSNGKLIVEFVARLGHVKLSAIGVEPASVSVTQTPVTETPVASRTPPATVSATPTPSATATPTVAPSKTATATASPTRTPTRTATSTVTATAVVSPPGMEIAVNCGGPLYHGADGILWQADKAYTAGSWGYVGGYAYSSSAAVAGTSDSTLYQTDRYALSAYRFDLPPGAYAVQLKFAEIYAWRVGQRIFNVVIEGQKVLVNLDLYALVGANKVYDRTFTVQVVDGTLDIGFVALANHAKVNAIRVTGAVALSP